MLRPDGGGGEQCRDGGDQAGEKHHLLLLGRTQQPARGDRRTPRDQRRRDQVPARTAYATRILSGTARWIAVSAGGNGAAMWDGAGTETPAFSFALDSDAAADQARIAALNGTDVTLA